MHIDLDDYMYILFTKAEHYKILMVKSHQQNKSYYKRIINFNIGLISNILDYKSKCDYSREIPNNTLKEFTLEDLAQYNGSNGSPAYVAVNGIVYDISSAPSWGGGTHFGLYSGKDLSSDFASCHGNISKLENYPKVGILKK